MLRGSQRSPGLVTGIVSLLNLCQLSHPFIIEFERQSDVCALVVCSCCFNMVWQTPRQFHSFQLLNERDSHHCVFVHQVYMARFDRRPTLMACNIQRERLALIELGCRAGPSQNSRHDPSRMLPIPELGQINT